MFTWVIKDYKSVQEPRIESPEFESGGCRWCILVYPKGDKVPNTMSMYMAVGGYEDMPPGWKIYAKFWLSIESPYERRAMDGAEGYFDSECTKWGLPSWLRRSELNDGFLDINGDLKIEARVDVFHKSRVNLSPSNSINPLFTWVIKDYKSVQERRIESPEFESGGCRWCVLVYPKGDKVPNTMSMYMAVAGYEDMPPGWKTYAKFWLSIESPYERRAMDGAEGYFDSERTKWGLPSWLRRSELNDGFLDQNGDLKIEARVDVLHKSRLHTSCCCGKEL